MTEFQNIDGRIYRFFWTVTWADKATGDLLGREELETITEDELIELMAIDAAEDLDDYSVGPRHAPILQRHMGHEIDFERYDYYYGQSNDPSPLATWGETEPASA